MDQTQDNSLLESEAEKYRKSQLAAAEIEIKKGAALAGLGTLVTVGSYMLAQGGGTYLITGGAIGYGIFYLGSGLYKRVKFRRKTE